MFAALPRRIQATTNFERSFLLLITAVLPLEDSGIRIAGFNFMFVVFSILAGYIFLKRLKSVNRTWFHPVFQAGYLLLVLAFVIESFHPSSKHYEIFQIGLMFGGAISVASLCRDREALRSCVYGYVIAGAWMSIVVGFIANGHLQAATATDFYEASTVRSSASEDLPRGWNLNAVARVTAEGATAALALALSGKARRRNLFLVAAFFCTVATFLPMSRGGIMMLTLSCAAVLRAYGVNAKVIIIALVFAAGILMAAPHVVFSRLTFSTEINDAGRMEARAQVYTAALEHFPEYVIAGVGTGNFWESWGYDNGFALGELKGVVGAHNAFFQTTIYWGLGGLLPLIAILVQAYRCLPKNCRADEVSLCILGIAALEFLSLFVGHSLYIKQHSLVLGLLVGARCWVWRQGIVRPTRRTQSRSFSK